jgi:hypothetical protein
MALNVFTPTPNPQQPGIAYSSTGQHMGLPFANPTGSTYATTYSHPVSNLLRQAIENKIYDTTNKQYAAFYAYYFGQPMLTKPSDEFIYMERGFGRQAMTIFTFVAPGGTNTAVITLAGPYTEANDIPVTTGDTIVLPVGNRPFVVTAVPTWGAGANSCTIPVKGYTNSANVATGVDGVFGDVISFQAANGADGTNSVNHYDRLSTTERYNYIQKYQRAYRFGQMELQKYINNATTDYVPQNKQNTMEQIRTDLFSTWLNGTRGEFAIPAVTSGSYLAKAMGGVYPTMVAAGAPSTSVTSSGLVPAVKALAFATNTLAKGATRFLLGTDQSLDILSTAWKNPVLYSPNDRIASLGLTQYELGTMKMVPIVCPMMGDSSIFPEFFSSLLLCVNFAAMNPVQMAGIPALNMYQTPMAGENGSMNAYSDFVVESLLGMQFNEPQSSFFVNII